MVHVTMKEAYNYNLPADVACPGEPVMGDTERERVREGGRGEGEEVELLARVIRKNLASS